MRFGYPPGTPGMTASFVSWALMSAALMWATSTAPPLNTPTFTALLLSNAAIQILQLDTQMICLAFGQPGNLVMKLGTEPQLQISITRVSLFLFTNRVPVPPSTNWCFPCLKLLDLSMQVTVTFLCMWAPFPPFLLHYWISGDAQRDHKDQVIIGIEQPGTAARRSLWLRAEAH